MLLRSQCNSLCILGRKRSPLLISSVNSSIIPEHGSSWHGDQEEDISYSGRIFVERLVVGKSR